MGNFERGTGAPEELTLTREQIEPIALQELQLDATRDAELMGQIKEYLAKETALPEDPQAIVLPLKLMADPDRGFGKEGLQQFLTHLPRTPYAQLQQLSVVLDDMYTHYQAEIEAAQVKNLSSVFPQQALLNQAVQEVIQRVPNFDGNLTADQKQMIKTRYDQLVAAGPEQEEALTDASVSFSTVLDQAFATATPEKQATDGKQEKKQESGLDDTKRKEFMTKTANGYADDIKALLRDTPYASLPATAYDQLAQGVFASYLPTVNAALAQEGALDAKDRMTMTDIAELLKVSPLDEKNELTELTPGEIKNMLVAYLATLDDKTPSWQGVAEAFSGYMTVDTLVNDMQAFKMYFDQGRPATWVDKMFKPLKKLGDRMSEAMQGVGNILDKLYQEYGPQLKEMLDMVKETFGFLGFGDNRDTSSFDEKIQSFIIETKGAMKPHEAKMTESLSTTMQSTHLNAGYSLDLYDETQLAETVYTTLFANPNLNDQLKSTPKYKRFLRAYKTDDVQLLMQQRVIQAIDGQPTEGTSARSPEELGPDEVISRMQRVSASWKGKLNGAIVISSPQKYFEMMSAYLLTGNESAALRLGLTEKETKVVEGAPLAASMKAYHENTCFLELPADAKQVGYKFMDETDYLPYDPAVGILRKSAAPTEQIELVAMRTSANGGMEGIPGTNKELTLQRDTDRAQAYATTVHDKDGNEVIPAHAITGPLLTTPRTPPKAYEYVLGDAATPPGAEVTPEAYTGGEEIVLPQDKVLYMRHKPTDALDVQERHTIPKKSGQEVGASE